MSDTPSVADAELAKIIGSEPARGRFRVLRWLIAAVALALAIGKRYGLIGKAFNFFSKLRGGMENNVALELRAA